MGTIVYLLCALTSVLCAMLLLREYRKSRAELLLWSCVAFGGLAVSNSLVFVDYVVWPDAVDLAVVRASVTLLSVSILITGLLWDAQ
jgi:hypothetical protein